MVLDPINVSRWYVTFEGPDDWSRSRTRSFLKIFFFEIRVTFAVLKRGPSLKSCMTDPPTTYLYESGISNRIEIGSSGRQILTIFRSKT